MYCRYIGSKFKKERERQRWWRGDYCYQIAGIQSLSNTATQGGASKKKNEPLVVDPNLTNPIRKPFTAPNEFSSTGYSSNWTRSIQSQRPDRTRLIRTHMWTRKRSDVKSYFQWWIKEKVAFESNRMLTGLVNWCGDDGMRRRKCCLYAQGNEQRDGKRRLNLLSWIRRVLVLSIRQKDWNEIS